MLPEADFKFCAFHLACQKLLTSVGAGICPLQQDQKVIDRCLSEACTPRCFCVVQSQTHKTLLGGMESSGLLACPAVLQYDAQLMLSCACSIRLLKNFVVLLIGSTIWSCTLYRKQLYGSAKFGCFAS